MTGTIIRRKIAALWKVEPYRVDVELVHGVPVYFLDNKPASPELVALTYQDEKNLVAQSSRGSPRN